MSIAFTLAQFLSHVIRDEHEGFPFLFTSNILLKGHSFVKQKICGVFYLYLATLFCGNATLQL